MPVSPNSVRPPPGPRRIAAAAVLRAIPLIALTAALAGCASGGFSLSQGGMSDATSSFASDHSYSYSCSKFDPATGAMTDQVIVSRNINPDAQAVAAMGSAFQAVVGLVGAVAKPVPGPAPGVMGGARGIPGGSTLDVPTCLGEHGVNTPMPALPPARADRPAMLEAPDPDGSPDAALQQRVRRAGGAP